MRSDFERYKEELRQIVIARYRVEPPGGIHPGTEANNLQNPKILHA